MTLDEITSALYATPVSAWIRETTWVVPFTQSLHILAIALVVGSALMMELRMAGFLAIDELHHVVVKRYLPWIWRGIGLLLLSGAALIVGEPNRVLANPLFWAKMGLVLFGVALTLVFRRPLLHADFRLEYSRLASFAKVSAWISLMVWIAVIFCGRWIAYIL
jgi:hypothetical protein